MKNFTNYHLHLYTDIHFGKDAEKDTGRLIRRYGGSRVMVVTGGGSVKTSGLFDRVIKTLKDEDLFFVEFGGVKPNPRRSLVEKGVKAAFDEKIDFVLCVGGGSVIDTGKSIALALANGGDFWKFFSGVPAEKMVPVGAIITIAAAGSETSRSAVLVDDVDTGRKQSVNCDCLRPVFAVINPELTYTVSAYQTAAGAADILAHTLGRYFTKDLPASRLGDEFAEGLMRTVVRYASIAVAKPDDYEARAELSMAAWVSHNDLTWLGRSGPRGGEHPLEHQLSGHYDTAHGAGLAAVMPAWLKYITDHGSAGQQARVAQFGVKVFGVDPEMGNIKSVAEAGLEAFRSWVRSIGMPLRLDGLGIPKEELPEVVKRTIDANKGKITGFMDLDEKAIAAIFDILAGS